MTLDKRTIKFRGKCCHSDAWAYGNLVDYEEEEYPEIQGFDVFREGRDVWQEMTVERDTIGQFTGLHDKNGKEIYEGDIVEVYDFTSVYASKYQGVVKMIHCTWVVEYEWMFGISHPNLYFDDFAERKTEVIGNIYDDEQLV